MRGPGILLLCLLLPTATALPLPAFTHACGGHAPDVVACTTGDHLSLGVLRSGGVSAGEGYNGIIVNRLTHAGGVFETRCDVTTITDGTFTSTTIDCTDAGTYPPAGAWFRHDCESLDKATPTPGGGGAWTCFIHLAPP